MAITKRTLEIWRSAALRNKPDFSGEQGSYLKVRADLNNKILRLTSELLDLQLIKEGEKHEQNT